MSVDPRAGKPTDASVLVNIPQLMTAHCTRHPDLSVRDQGEGFGTSGRRRSATDGAFKEGRILAIAPAICLYQVGTPG